MVAGGVRTLRTDTGVRARGRVPRVLMADDSRNEHLLMLMAAEEATVPMEFQFVDDGSALLSHLARARGAGELPDLIVLDLRMPVLDGHSTLMSLKSDPTLWEIPVVVFTTSTSTSDVERSLGLGAAFVRVKPSGFIPMMEFVRELHAVCVSGETPDSSAVIADDLHIEFDDEFQSMEELTIDLEGPWRR